DVLAAVNPDAPLIPASTQKLMTATAALTVLGPDFRYETAAVATDAGPALGNLWLVGSGDPVIRTADSAEPGVSTSLESLADSIVAHGVRSVGSVVGDDHRYDDQRFVPTWSPLYREEFDVGPLGALTVTEGIPLVNGKPVLEADPALYAAQ